MTSTPGTKLRAFRRALGWTTGQAAERVGCERSYVSLLEGGHRTPSLKIAAAIERLTAEWGEGPIRCTDWITAGEPAAEAA